MKTDDSGCQRGMKHVVIIALCALAAVCPALGDSTDDAESIAAWRRVAEPPPGILPDFGASELARLPLPLQDCARRIEAVRNLQAAAEKGDAQAQRAMAALHGKPETDASAEEVVCPYAPLTFGENEIEAARWQKRAHRDASERLNVEECAREERARDEGWQVSWGEGSDVLDSSSALERDAQDDADARFMLGIVLYVTAGGLEDDTWFMSFAEIVEHGGCRGRERQEGLR
ncbi:MAG: hypothetical protein LBC37_07850, partial [Zoogloeaceae bacterium]|nr:hypothetical protein [Zoogloeaceae bacterium]